MEGCSLRGSSYLAPSITAQIVIRGRASNESFCTDGRNRTEKHAVSRIASFACAYLKFGCPVTINRVDSREEHLVGQLFEDHSKEEFHTGETCDACLADVLVLE